MTKILFITKIQTIPHSHIISENEFYLPKEKTTLLYPRIRIYAH